MNKELTIEKLRQYTQDEKITRVELKKACDALHLDWPNWLVNDKVYRVDRGVYSLAGIKNTSTKKTQSAQLTNVLQSNADITIEVPKKDETYIRSKHFTTIKKVFQSELFCPVYMQGLSGCGKTFTVQQVCAELNKPLARVNITSETEEDCLLGGFRLINGETKWFDGPVTLAMKQGAILLLDEIDLASSKIMCLQPILEGSGIFLKKIGEHVQPKPGFNIVATANTKGLGDDSGKFVATSILNEALLDRFSLFLEYDYHTLSEEKKVLEKQVEFLNLSSDPNISNILEALGKWGDQIRDGYKKSINEDIISTRRLVHILKAYAITNDIKKSIEMCIERFPDESKEAFKVLFDQFYVSSNQAQENDELNLDNYYTKELVDIENIPF